MCAIRFHALSSKVNQCKHFFVRLKRGKYGIVILNIRLNRVSKHTLEKRIFHKQERCQQVAEAFTHWWADLINSQYTEITVRLFLAALLGGLVGLEREQSNRPAGFRTHILVCVGSALIMLISMYGFEDFIAQHKGRVVADPARLAAQVVSGIGFLGAGTILVHGFAVRGLTTAASLWVVAGIGLALGAGFYYGALLATGLVLLSLIVLNRLDHYIIRRGSGWHTLRLKVRDTPGMLGKITTQLGEHGVDIQQLSIREDADQEEGVVQLHVVIQRPEQTSFPLLIEHLSVLDGVHEVISDAKMSDAKMDE